MLPKAALSCAAALAASVSVSAAAAQPRTPPPGGTIAAPAATPVRVDPTTVEMPDLAFQPTPEIEGDYGKYHYFHRTGTDFDTAYADILECDGYSRGFTHYAAPVSASNPSGAGIGGAIADSIVDAISGSAERRRLRRVNMRTCMQFKGYRLYGLPERLWDQFNFTEGLNVVDAPRRARMLLVQARVASGPAPTIGEITQ